MNAIDANVLIYSVDDTELAKQRIADRLLDHLATGVEATIIPAQAAVEYLACLRKWENLGRHTRDVTQDHLGRLLDSFSISPASPAILSHSLELSSRYSLSHWDSLLLAACIEAGVETLYSEDMQDGMTYDGVRVVNPFALSG